MYTRLITAFLLSASLSLAACGGDKAKPDAKKDAKAADAKKDEKAGDAKAEGAKGEAKTDKLGEDGSVKAAGGTPVPGM